MVNVYVKWKEKLGIQKPVHLQGARGGLGEAGSQ